MNEGITETMVQDGARAVWRGRRRLPIPWMWMPVWWRQRQRDAFERGLRMALYGDELPRDRLGQIRGDHFPSIPVQRSRP